MIVAGPPIATLVFFYTPILIAFPPVASTFAGTILLGYVYGAVPSIAAAIAWWLVDRWGGVRLWAPLTAAIIGAITSFGFEALVLKVLFNGEPFDLLLYTVLAKPHHVWLAIAA